MKMNRIKGDGVYYERHHIIPRSLCGDNSKSNLVLLTAKEHFVCHLLLTKMVTGDSRRKMVCALSKMAFQSNRKQFRKLTAGEYELARTLFAKEQKEFFAGREPWNKGKTAANDPRVALNAMNTAITKATWDYHLSDEHKRKISKFHSNRLRGSLSLEHRAKLSEQRTGRVAGSHSEETKEKQGGVEYYCPVTGKTKRFKTHLGEVVSDGWIKGRLVKEPMMWITNGIENTRCKVTQEAPDGWYRGRVSSRASNGMFMESI